MDEVSIYHMYNGLMHEYPWRGYKFPSRISLPMGVGFFPHGWTSFYTKQASFSMAWVSRRS